MIDGYLMTVDETGTEFLDGLEILAKWKPPVRLLTDNSLNDVAVEYAVVRCPDAAWGMMIFAYYGNYIWGNHWCVNPWGGRHMGFAWLEAKTELAEAKAHIAELEAQGKRLRKDEQRLNWLDGEFEREARARISGSNMPGSLFRRNEVITREVIDKEMRQAHAKGGTG